MNYLIFTGVVEKGEGIASNLGCPTANISIEQGSVIPGLGIYVGRTEYKGNKYPSLIIITDGRDGNELRLEVNMIDQKFGNLEGDTLVVEVYEKIRDNLKWESDEQVKKMFEKDLIQAHQWFKDNPDKQ